MSGKVYLVGAGPGDPELITQKGARLLASAEVVVYDFLANPELLALAPEGAERIYVGKKGGQHTMGQAEINDLLCDLAAAGKTVVRLKGGDPFVFGRGGEEASALRARGLDFEVVPGVTSAVAAPAYAGIPVTDRRCSTEVAFVTGHEDPGKEASTIDWAALARLGTVVFLMGVKNLPSICQSLLEQGKPPDTPAACIRWGATPEQQTVSATLAELPAKVAAAGLTPPAITVVGPVASLRPELNWFERLPLFGRRVVVTRARAQASRLSAALSALGARVLEIPTIAIEPPNDTGPLNRAVAAIEEYDWLVFTSPNGVEAFWSALWAAGRDLRALGGLKVAVIGPATAQGLEARGLRPEVMAKRFVAEGLLEALEGHDLKDRRMLLPRAARARAVLPDTLRSWGARVEQVAAYQSRTPPESAARLAQALKEGIDAITFTASSTVTGTLALLPDGGRALAEQTRAGRVVAASIGPITTRTAQEAGLEVAVQPATYTIEALVEALALHFAAR